MLAKVLEEGNDSSGWWIDEKLEGNDSSGWWIGEKLDGVRAYWDGRDFYSRQGQPFPCPEWQEWLAQ